MNSFISSRVISALHLSMDAALSVLPRSRKPHILIACMPKSGSTLLASALAEIQGLRRVRLTPTWGDREQELCLIRLSRYNHTSYVAQHHVRNSAWTQRLITKFRMTPVVLLRDLADVVISARDHLRQDPASSPMAHFMERHLDLPDDELEEAIVRLSMPWYINFYAGWRADPRALVIDYSGLIDDPVGTMAAILNRANVNVSDASIRQALERCDCRHTRFNVGSDGRGKAMSSQAAKSLLRLLEFYPDFDTDPLFVRTRSTLGQRKEVRPTAVQRGQSRSLARTGR